MSIVAWLVLGIMAGFLSSKLVNKQGAGLVGDLIVGIIGAFAGGFLFNFFGMAGVTGFNLWSLLVSAVGASVLLVAYNLLSGRR